jgi:hypothetical protein
MDIKVKASEYTPLPAFTRSFILEIDETNVDSYQTTLGELFDFINGITRMGTKSDMCWYLFTDQTGGVLLSVDLAKVSGNPLVKIGTNNGGDELTQEYEVTGLSTNGFNLPFSHDDYIYIGIRNGSVKVNVRTLTGYFL